MSESRIEGTWRTLPNPFNILDKSDIITSHVSGRSADIIEIITGGQSAIVLAGAPGIGKSALIHYLKRLPDSEWSWRNELIDLSDQLKLNDIHFVQVDLRPLEGIGQKDNFLSSFVEQCTIALQGYMRDKQSTLVEPDLKGLLGLLRSISREVPHARYFLMLDAIERLGWHILPSFPLESTAETEQERGIALLDHCGAIRTLVDLIDEFRTFGVILSIDSLPRPKIDDQFKHVSADLARFKTITLQTFTLEDTTKFLAQEPENFGTGWAKLFNGLGGDYIFSRSEQEWLRKHAGTHPYLIQQFCFYTFHLKQQFASINGTWTELLDEQKDQLIERISEFLNTFLASTWKRLHEAIVKGRQETKSKFDEFIRLLSQKQANEVLDRAFWDYLGPELRYILYSEGIVRYDLSQPIHFPGATLSNYLVQKANESIELPVVPPVGGGRNLLVKEPGNSQVQISLSELEYKLFKTLLLHPKRCTEEELMVGAWGMKINRPVFTQRMHQLRKKLKGTSETDIIENRYGGIYTINNPEWLYLE